MKDPKKLFPFKRAAIFFGVAIPSFGWISNALRANKAEKKLAKYTGPHKQPCELWTEQIKVEKPDDLGRE
jgi:hypothetical protein